jgi:DNA helicase-2/ATP-dependent DNA helicase PcrA
VAWEDGLSEEQRRAASAVDQYVRLLAGPGTGKTRTLTNRVAYLQERDGVEAGEILVLTFGRAAARELRDRLQELGVVPPMVLTLHGFALRQLLRNGAAPDVPEPILIADDLDERHVIQEDLKIILKRPVRRVRDAFQDLAADWETLDADTEQWESAYPDPSFLGAFREHRTIFGYTMRSELVYRVKRALHERPDFQLEKQFAHVIIDEYQDLNRCELEVVRALAGAGAKVYVAGDDDQSIYGFRHAFPQGIREFPNTYRGAADEELEVCHRCDKEILRLALSVAALDPRRVEKNLQSASEANGTVEVLGFQTGTAEAKGIARICKFLIEVKNVPAGEILILQRRDFNAAFSTPIIEQLNLLDIRATRLVNPFAILEREDGRQVVCVLRLLADREDGLAWGQLLELRDNGVGSKPLSQVYELARERNVRFSVALTMLRSDIELIEARNRQRLADDLTEIDLLLDALQPLLDEQLPEALVTLLQRVLDREDVADFFDVLFALTGEEKAATVRDVFQGLQAVRDYVDEMMREGEEDTVRLMTMHAAKGLTATAVIVPNGEDELLPGNADNETQEGDERRLLYVSLTRACHFLYVTYAARRSGMQARAGRATDRHSLTRFLQGLVTPKRGKDFLDGLHF